MKLRTSLQLSAIFPILFAVSVILFLYYHAVEMDVRFIAMFGLLGIAMAAIILSYSRAILERIRILNGWVDSILKGNLSHQVEISEINDEVGNLSKALNKMLGELQQAYAALNQEATQYKSDAAEYKRKHQASETAAKALSGAIDRIKVSHENEIRYERMRLLEQIISGMSHDLGDAIAPILGTCELFTNNPSALSDREKTLAGLKNIQAGAERAKSLIKNTAVYFRSSKEEPSSPTDVNNAVDQALDYTRPYWGKQAEKGRKMEVQTRLSLTPPVAMEATDLADAIARLLVNSVEAMPNGGIIAVSSKCEGDMVVLEVRDNGRGMDKEILDRCLEPFFSMKEIRKRGVGIGLTIVNGAVLRYGGKVEIESKPAVGTSVRLKIPVWSKCKTDGPKEAASEPGQALRILLVDDVPVVLLTTEQLLIHAGHKVEKAENAYEGLRKMKDAKFDVAMIDKAMPGMDGEQLAVEIMKMSPGTAVVMFTGFGDIMLAEDRIPAGVDVVLAKPARSDDLCSALARAMGLCRKRIRDSAGISVVLENKKAEEPRTVVRRMNAEEEGNEENKFKWM